MRETDFIAQNKEKWRQLEELNASKKKDPEKLGDLFVEVTNDLSFAKSYFPNRSIRIYLNNLALKVHSTVYKSRSGMAGQVKTLCLETIPKVYREARWSILIAVLLFFGAVLIGVLSSHQDPGFIGVMLPQSYIDMTLDNIAKKDPMAVYKGMGQLDMFTMITFNNIFVAFRVFLLGVLFMVGTVAAMLFEGSRLGAFHYLFYENGYLQESLLTVWMHGTPEISGIILAGAAGLELGKGLVFPGTFQRKESFLIGAKRGLIMMLGLIPVFIFAGFIEGFATRYTDMPDALRLSFILLSASFILYYFIILPWRQFRHLDKKPIMATRVPEFPDHDFHMGKVKNHGQILADGFSALSNTLSDLAFPLLGCSFIYAMAVFFLHSPDGGLFQGVLNLGMSNAFQQAISRSFQQVAQLYDCNSDVVLYVLNSLFMAGAILIGLVRFSRLPGIPMGVSRIKAFALPLLIAVLVFHLLFFLPSPLGGISALVLAPFGFSFLGRLLLEEPRSISYTDLILASYGRLLAMELVFYVTGVLFLIFFNSGITDYLLSQVLTNLILDDEAFNLIMMGSNYLFTMFTLSILVLLHIFGSYFIVHSALERLTAGHLRISISKIGERDKAYGLLRED